MEAEVHFCAVDILVCVYFQSDSCNVVLIKSYFIMSHVISNVYMFRTGE